MTITAQYEMLRDFIIDDFGETLAGDITLFQDAIYLELLNGTQLEIKAASNEEYAFVWKYGDRVLRIDTAPLHPDLATFPHHLHDAAGMIRPDPLSHPGAPLRENVKQLLTALNCDPLLGHGTEDTQ
ncbi:MAG: hypothetical protein HYZ18_05535 [Pseudogulbenkiania sp.]|nr:hypothetical protein [Pseudogulbenkiania sp.]